MMAFPQLKNSSYTSNNYSLTTTGGAGILQAGQLYPIQGQWVPPSSFGDFGDWPLKKERVYKPGDEGFKEEMRKFFDNQAKDKPKEENSMRGDAQMGQTSSGRRIVKVFIVDNDANVSLEKSILHSGEEKLTDATDQELFYEIGVAELLKSHNAYRVATLNKKATERAGKDVFLEPIKIRDLIMNVVTVAAF